VTHELTHTTGDPGVPPVRQDGTPYLDALVAYSERQAGRYHVPGHKGGPSAPARLSRFGGAITLDIPACTRGIDVGSGLPPLHDALVMAAKAWGARRTWFLVNGASEGSHVACLALAASGDRVVIQRNVHSSTIHGLILAGLRPTFVSPELDDELGIAHCVTPEALDRALSETPDAVGAFVVSPTYFGAAADLRGLAAVCHARGVPLVVDEAWGAHFAFHPELPEDALASGADLVISGTHKLVGSLTQSAMLHLGHEGAARLDQGDLDRAVRLVRSTSPSSLLLGSLDAARHHVATEGRRLLDAALSEMMLLRDALCEVPGLDVLDQQLARRPGVHDFDPFRLVIDVRSTGRDGFALAEALHGLSDINLELVTDRLLVVHFGLGEPLDVHGQRLLDAMVRVLQEPLPSARAVEFEPPTPAGELVLSPREAFLALHDNVPLHAAGGRISADSVVIYPPGIANILPGERITGNTIRHLLRMIELGCSLRGTGQWAPDAIRVVRDGS
jgi:arginine decarboxylase